MLADGATLLATDGTFVRPVALQNIALASVVANAFPSLHGEALNCVKGVTTSSIAVILVLLGFTPFPLTAFLFHWGHRRPMVNARAPPASEQSQEKV